VVERHCPHWIRNLRLDAARFLFGAGEAGAHRTHPATLLGALFEGVEQLLESSLVGSHSLGRPSEFDEHVSAGTFDDRAQETVSGYDGRRRGLGTGHPGILA
jgi:hypothetical protein